MKPHYTQVTLEIVLEQHGNTVVYQSQIMVWEVV